jgi:hypothetical protein
MNIKIIANSLYGFFGTVFLVVGAGVLLLPTGLLPDTVENIIVNFGHGDLNTLHIIQELGSILVFVGLITFWFIRHYEHSVPFHWAMTTFWGLFALAHWFDVSGSFRSGIGQMINTIPFILFVLVGLLRKRREVRAELR